MSTEQGVQTVLTPISAPDQVATTENNGGGLGASLGSLMGLSGGTQPGAGNPIFSAGLGLMVLGAGFGFLKRGATTGLGGLQRRMFVSLEITSKDRAYPWLLYWMGKQAAAASYREQGMLPPLPKETALQLAGLRTPPSYDASQPSEASQIHHARGHTEALQVHNPLQLSDESSLEPVRMVSHELSVETSVTQGDQGETQRSSTSFILVPGPGTHFFRYHGRWMRLQRDRVERSTDITTGKPFETVKLSTLRVNSFLFPQLLEEARKLALTALQGKTTIYTSWSIEWRPFGRPRRPRELSSVILHEGLREHLLADVEGFLDRGKWYAERGIPYRRGYLFHGAPGSGKSSFIMALAGYLDYNICLLNLSERGMTDDRLTHLLSNAPERSIILLEDIDAAFTGRQSAAEDGYQANVTFSGLLNALDGVASGESRIVFMTTNHVDKLDPALVRPGRADVIAELGDAEPEQVRRLVKRFYKGASQYPTSPGSLTTVPDLDPADVDVLADQLAQATERVSLARRKMLGLDPSGRYLVSPGMETEQQGVAKRTAIGPRPPAHGGVSMAELQGLFIRYPDDPRAAVKAFIEESAAKEAEVSHISNTSTQRIPTGI